MLISNMAIVFSNAGLKVSKYGIFEPKLKKCLFHMKLCILTNLRVLKSNMTKVFSNFSPKTPK